MTQTAMKPIDKMLASFPGARQKSNGRWEHNPGYGTHFDFWETPDGIVRMNVWNGADYKQVLAEGEPPLKPRDLYPRTGKRVDGGKPYAREQLTLQQLADYMMVDRRDLLDLGHRDEYTYTNKAKGITSIGVKLGGYCYPDGREYDRAKVRLSLDGKFRFVWDENTPGDPIPCGLHRLDDARRAEYLFLCEGESDWATFQWHNFPALGISGADAIRSLDVSLLKDIPRVYIVEEPDQVKKNLWDGKGFYKSVRAHLRGNGYTGEIFSIRWKQATGAKDPSDLHKALYASISLMDETVFKAELRKRFGAVIEQAMVKALPEGVTSIAEYIEPDPEPEQFPRTNRDLRQWITELNAVPSETLSSAHKIVLQTIMLFTQWWDPEQERWFKVDSAFLAKQAGMSTRIFLTHVAYLTDKVGLFVKKKDTIWFTDMDAPQGKKKCTNELYIHPAPQAHLAYPCTFHVIEDQPARNHGGNRTPGPKCADCGSENINEDVYKWHYCRDCHSQHMYLQEDQSKSYGVESKVQVVSISKDIYSESKVQLDVCSFESDPDPQGVSTDPYPDPQGVSTDPTPEELAPIAQELNAHLGKPCTALRKDGTECGCTLYHTLAGHEKCCICSPPITSSTLTTNRLRSFFKPDLRLGA